MQLCNCSIATCVNGNVAFRKRLLKNKRFQGVALCQFAIFFLLCYNFSVCVINILYHFIFIIFFLLEKSYIKICSYKIRRNISVCYITRKLACPSFGRIRYLVTLNSVQFSDPHRTMGVPAPRFINLGDRK